MKDLSKGISFQTQVPIKITQSISGGSQERTQLEQW